MGDFIDAVNPDNIGPEWDGAGSLRITVLANHNGQVFDYESGNAGAAAVASGIAARRAAGRWSIGYVNESNVGDLTAELTAYGEAWTDAEHFPAAGCYMWAADPSGNIAAGKWVPPVRPLMVQDRYVGPFDLSTVPDNFPAKVAGYLDGPRSMWPPAAWTRFRPVADQAGAPPPVPPEPPAPPVPPAPPKEIDVKLLQLQEGSKGRTVQAAQTLLGDLATDGIFGPKTKGRVMEYQSQNHLTVDGVLGAHTWGALLGVPQ